MRMTSARATAVAATCVLLLGALASPMWAQEVQQTTRWLPFVGCWEPMGVDGDPGLLCFRLDADGVAMSNVFEGDVTAAERLVADGVARPVSAEGCSGTESVEFSQDGRRVFTASSFLCEGGEARRGSGVMSFISPTQWIDVRSLTVEGEPVAWVQRYAAATTESLNDHGLEPPSPAERAAVRTRRLLAARDIEMSDVEEAVQRLDAQAVKIWIATQESEFDLSGSELVRLADSGVPEDVLDIMVAVSFPDRFAVTPEGVPEGVVNRVAGDAYRSGARVGFRSFLWDPYYAPIGYRYGYSPFGYYGYGYGGYYGYVPASVTVVPRPDVSSGGRIVRGQGYRGPSSGGGASSGGPRPSGGAATSSGGSGGGGSTSSGSSSPPRTAVPRGNN